MILALTVLLIVILIFALIPPSLGKLPKPAEKLWIKVDGTNLGLIILSKNTDNPVLMLCGGGPGIPNYLLENSYSSPLSEEFTVCYWDYRGTGLSYDKRIIPQNMTAELFVSDALAVTDYLLQRFSKEKIFIMGHSYGTYIALNAVQLHPEKYECYIAMSQICNQKESEYTAFDYMKERYKELGNKRMEKQFSKYNIRESKTDYDDYFFSGLRDKAMHDLGVGTARNMRSVVTGIFLSSLRCTAYTQSERINIWRGKILSGKFPAAHHTIGFNAFNDAPHIEIPVFFVAGKYDYTCCTYLQQKYYEFVDAPLKKLYIFENSAHSPLYEEHDKAKNVLQEIKLTLKQRNDYDT